MGRPFLSKGRVLGRPFLSEGRVLLEDPFSQKEGSWEGPSFLQEGSCWKVLSRPRKGLWKTRPSYMKVSAFEIVVWDVGGGRRVCGMGVGGLFGVC